VADSWHKQASKFIKKIKSGVKVNVDLSGLVWFLEVFKALWEPPQSDGKSSIELSERDKTMVSEAEKKSQKLGYEVKIRMAYLGKDQEMARIQMQSIVGAFKQFNSTNLNGFRLKGKINFNHEELHKYVNRQFVDSGFILNIEELASIYHLPHTNVETPNIVWANTKKAEPPTQLPILTGNGEHDSQISAFGLTDFHGIHQQFGMYRSDRSRHVYVIGQTGTGKSGLLELFALSDIFHNQGYAIIDPHGDYAINNLRFIPEHRIKDVVYFNPADTAFPLGFNPMEIYDPSQRNNTSSEIIGVLKRMFDNSWGPRLEYILRYTLLALLENEGTTLLDITKMLTDKKFREKILLNVTDAVVRNFWYVEFAGWTERYIAEAVPPILNKVGAFVANPIIRNIIGQPKSTFNIREIMDEGKILVVNLSKGLIGEDNAAILGSFIVTKVQLAAMSRSDIPRVEDRRPFYLYVDEFQNFATDSFAVILSEARKYGLNLTVANQYVSQMDETVRDAVFGNVGTMISMRVSAEDSPLLAKQFEPQFEPGDLLNMNNRHFIVNMVIKGEKTQPFSATTLGLPPAQTNNNLDAIIANSRTNHARPYADIEAEIGQSMMPSAASLPKGVPNPNDPRVQAAQSVGVDPKVMLKTSPSGTTGSQKLVIPGFEGNKPKAEIEITQPAKKKRTRSHNKKTNSQQKED
jgi:Predicted ATPase